MNIDSITVETNAELIIEIRKLILHYRSLFREAPKAIAVNPTAWLQIGITTAEIARAVDRYRSDHSITIDGVDIYCKLNGPPEIVARPEDVKLIAYMKSRDDKRLWPILMGA